MLLTVPGTVSITPSNAAVGINAPITLTGRFQDADGWQDLRLAEFRVADSFFSSPRCLVRYDQNLNTLSLHTGSSWLNAGAPGSGSSVSTSNCTLDAAASSVNPVNATTLDVSINVSFEQVMEGNRNLWLRAFDDSGDWGTQDDRGNINIGDGASYRVTFTSTWSSSTHPTDFPSNPHFSGLIGATHDGNYSMWAPGQIASQGIENMAELGNRTLLYDEISDLAAAGVVGSVLSGPGLSTSPSSATYDFAIGASFPLVSLTSMIAPSPDWFVGVHDLSLKDAGNQWYDTLTVSLDPYDAGTDNGVTYVAPNSDTQPPAPISNIRGVSPFSNAPVASFTFTRTDVPTDPPPAAPTGLGASAGNQQVALDWANNTEPDLDGYNVYRSTTSGGAYAKINSALLSGSSYTDTGVANGTTYYYVVTAVDLAGNESAYSGQASANPTGGSSGPVAPTTISITPNNPTVEVGTQIVLTGRFADANGADDIRLAEFRTSDTFFSAPRCLVRYDNLLDTLRLHTGSSWLDAGAPGTGSTVSTADCSLNAAASSVTPVDANTIDVAIAVTYGSSLEGNRNLWLRGFDDNGQWGTQDDRGDITIEPDSGGPGGPVPPTTVSITPNNPAVSVGQEILLTGRFADANGADDIRLAEFRVSNSFFSAPRCLVRYDQLLNTLRLHNGSAWLDAGAPGTGGSVSTADCTLDAGDSTVNTVSAEAIDVTIALTFGSSLQGNRNLWLRAFDNDNQWGTQDDRGDITIT